MKRILVTGLKDPAGGVESAVMGYIRQFDRTVLQVDVAVFGEVFSLSAEIEARGGKVWYLPSRVRQPQAYKKALSDVFQETKYDAVWCNFSGLTNIDFLKQAKTAGVPIRIAHAHTAAFAWGTPLMRYVVPMLHYKNQRVLHRFATHLWACSMNAAVFMYGESPFKQVSLIANAIDVDTFAFSPALREEMRACFGFADQPVILHVGRMCTAKNQKFLLDIFKAVLAKRSDARLLFVGDGELHDAVHAYADAIGVSHAVTFTGMRQGTADILQAGDVFLLPSVTEGFPVTVMEAQAAGLPCVVSAQAVPREIDVTGNVEFLSLQAPADVWAEKLLSVCNTRAENTTEKVKAAGYDTKSAAKKMQTFFAGKKVGMVTFPRAVNYGTALQAAALQTALQAHGANAYFADHVCQKIADADKLFDIKQVFDFKYTAAHLLNLPTAQKRARRFSDFATAHMRFNSEDPALADIMVAGSDQIWNGVITGNDEYYFLNFEKGYTKKTAYAASFGVSDIPHEQYPRLRDLLLDFDVLSVREEQAAKIVQDITGKTVPIVPDPTLLLTREDWEPYMAPKADNGYIFVYTVFNSDSLWKFAEDLSCKTGLPIKTVSYSTLHKHNATYDYTAGPAQWLRYMADAAYVVTNSFHGVAFSVNFEKQFFYELPPAKSGVGSRLSHITAHYGLSNRALHTANLGEKIDFSAARELLCEDRRFGNAFIDEILNV